MVGSDAVELNRVRTAARFRESRSSSSNPVRCHFFQYFETKSACMHLWIDADACPVMIREVLFKAAMRRQMHLTLVANQTMQTPRSPYLHSLRVAPGFDVADNEIVSRCEANDLVITSDIPLAAEVVAKGAHALSPRGEHFTSDTIGERLNLRDFMDTLRGSGIHTGGPPPMNKADRQAFANQLDRLLTRHG